MWQLAGSQFLFGFSRGRLDRTLRRRRLSHVWCTDYLATAYTPLSRIIGSARKIAKEAVKKVYQHVGSQRDTAYLETAKGARASVPQEVFNRIG